MRPYQANEYEKDWPTWAMLVRAGQTDEAFGDMRNRMVGDEEFQQHLKKGMVWENRQCCGTVAKVRALAPESRGRHWSQGIP